MDREIKSYPMFTCVCCECIVSTTNVSFDLQGKREMCDKCLQMDDAIEIIIDEPQ